MTIVLGIHLGHDASVSIVDERGLVCSVLQERLTRVRHDYGIETETVNRALSGAGLSWSEIDEVAITATQLMPAVIRGGKNDLVLGFNSIPEMSSNETSYQGRSWVSSQEETSVLLLAGSSDENTPQTPEIYKLLSQERKIPEKYLSEFKYYLLNDPLRGLAEHKNPVEIAEVLERVHFYSQTSETQSQTLQMSELEVSFMGVPKPAKLWAHHASHAASNVAIDYRPRPIITHDGGQGIQSGAVWYWTGSDLNLITPHYLELGQLYDFFGLNLGLGTLGAAGKLMGLSAYGPIDFPQLPVTRGNIIDWSNSLGTPSLGLLEGSGLYKKIWDLSFETVSRGNLDLTAIGDPSRVTENAPSSIARSIQDYVQSTFSKFSKEVAKILNSQILGISGGFALNCPTNTAISLGMPKGFEVIVEPHCEDGGCSIGAAYLSYLQINKRLPSQATNSGTSSAYAYAGLEPANSELELTEKYLETRGLKGSVLQNTGLEVARLLIDDKVVAVYSSKSEIGPRALGHRSILANPAPKKNWDRVNQIKRREWWRPFAPAVLEEYLSEYFELGPRHSPFMLFNYVVKSKSSFQAITHQDETARVQTVDAKTNPLYEILESLRLLGHPPVVMNTSFNGPGEPIVESVIEALNLFLESDIDCLLIESLLIQKL